MSKKSKRKRKRKTYEQIIMADLARRPVRDYPSSRDALAHRLPGSFESGKGR